MYFALGCSLKDTCVRAFNCRGTVRVNAPGIRGAIAFLPKSPVKHKNSTSGGKLELHKYQQLPQEAVLVHIPGV